MVISMKKIWLKEGQSWDMWRNSWHLSSWLWLSLRLLRGASRYFLSIGYLPFLVNLICIGLCHLSLKHSLKLTQIYRYIHIYIYISMYIHKQIHMYVCEYIYVCACVHTRSFCHVRLFATPWTVDHQTSLLFSGKNTGVNLAKKSGCF